MTTTEYLRPGPLQKAGLRMTTNVATAKFRNLLAYGAGGAAYDFDQLARDAGLANLVHL
jgi:hypothetical protein